MKHDLLPAPLFATYIEQVVQAEGPAHLDKAVTRIRKALGLKRAGARIRDAIEAASELAIRKGSIVRDSEFFLIEGRIPALRDRSKATSASLRKPEMLPLDEVSAGAVSLSEANFGATADQLLTETSRGLGLKATSEVCAAEFVKAFTARFGAGCLRNNRVCYMFRRKQKTTDGHGQFSPYRAAPALGRCDAFNSAAASYFSHPLLAGRPL